MIEVLLFATTVTLYGLGMHMMNDWIPQVNRILVASGSPKMSRSVHLRMLATWPYLAVKDIIKDRKYA